MGWGDEIIASGLARGAKARGKRIAFGDGRRIIWSPMTKLILQGNPNVAQPGCEGASDLEWIEHYAGRRVYLDTKANKQRWFYNRKFKVIPGEMFFTDQEMAWADSIKPGFVLIEPSVKPAYPNKQWPVDRYAAVAKKLIDDGHTVVQFVSGSCHPLHSGVKLISTITIRYALAALTRTALVIGPEGALVHGAAAAGVKSVVLFGGFTDPAVVGYDGNFNLTGGVEHCGSVVKCSHCEAAMRAITVDQVCSSVKSILENQQ